MIKEICTAPIFPIEWKHSALYNSTSNDHKHTHARVRARAHTHITYGQQTEMAVKKADRLETVFQKRGV